MNKRFILLLVVAVVVGVLFGYSSMLQGEFYQIVEFFKELVARDERTAMMVFVLLSALTALISPLTNIPLVPFAVALWGSELTVVLILLGWLLGDIVAYIIGRYLGYATISYIFSREHIDGWSGVVKKHTNFTRALFARFVFPAELGYAFGIIKYNFSHYLAITFLAELPFALVSAYASEAVLAGDMIKFLWLTGVLFAIIFLAFRSLHKKS